MNYIEYQIAKAEAVGKILGLERLLESAEKRRLYAANISLEEGYYPPYVTYIDPRNNNLAGTFATWPVIQKLPNLNEYEQPDLAVLTQKIQALQVCVAGQMDLGVAREMVNKFGAKLENTQEMAIPETTSVDYLFQDVANETLCRSLRQKHERELLETLSDEELAKSATYAAAFYLLAKRVGYAKAVTLLASQEQNWL